MIREIIIGSATPLQFGSYVGVQIIFTIDGVQQYNEYMSFDANKFSVVYDAQNPNIVVFHFGNIMQSVGNADYNQFSYAGVPSASLIELAQAVITDIAAYTT